MSHRPKYTGSQRSAYLSHISLPSPKDFASGLPHSPSDILSLLTRLQQHQLCTVPFENLSLHYSTHHTISLDPQSLFKKIVEDGRGGYCMENNCFFGTVLRSLGFSVHSVGARVSAAADGRGGEEYSGWSHMVNIVTLTNGTKYMVDVGFGGKGPIRPLLLDAKRSTAKGIGQAEIRVVRQNIPENVDEGQRLWIYQHRNHPEAPWLPMYCFTELEFLPRDYEIMNFWTSQSRKSWFTQTIVAVKMVMKEGEVVGTIILEGGEVKRRLAGETEHLRTCKIEKERVEALELWFGVELREEEQAGIRGLVTELKG